MKIIIEMEIMKVKIKAHLVLIKYIYSTQKFKIVLYIETSD